MLSELPNIGKTLEKRLRAIGVDTQEELGALGSLGALKKLDAINDPGCINMLYALEGALRGVRWHKLPTDVKDELKFKLEALHHGAVL